MTTKYTPTVIRVASTSPTTSTKTTAPRRRPRCKNKIKHNESENRRRERLRAKFDELREVLGMDDPTDRCTLLDRAITTIRSYTKRKRSRQQMEESTKQEIDDDLPLTQLDTSIQTESATTSVKEEISQSEEIPPTTRVTRQAKDKEKKSKLNFTNQVDIEIAHVNMHSIDESVVAAVTAAARSASASLSNSPTIPYRSTSPTSSITSSSSSHSPVSPCSPTPAAAPISSLVALAAAARQSPSAHQSSSTEKSHKRPRLSTSSHDFDKLRHESSISPKSMISTSSSIPTALLALDGRILDVNVSFCTLLGHDQVTLTSQTIFALTHPSELSTLFEIMKRMLANEIPSYDAVQRCIRRDGSILMVHIHMSMITQGDLSYFLCSLQPSNSPTVNNETVTPLVYSNSPSLSSARNFLFPPLTRSTSPPPVMIPRSSTGSSLTTSSSAPSLTNLTFPLFTRVRPPLPTSTVNLAPLLSRFPLNFTNPIETLTQA